MSQEIETQTVGHDILARHHLTLLLGIAVFQIDGIILAQVFIERVAKKQGIAPEEAAKIIKEVDAMRERYVKNYTKTSRYDARNYDLVINMDGHTEDEVVSFILNYIDKSNK